MRNLDLVKLEREQAEAEKAQAALQESEPTAEEARARDLEARENRLKCRDYLDQHQLLPEFLDVFNTDSEQEFVQSMEKLLVIMDMSAEIRQKEEQPTTEKVSKNQVLRSIFGILGKE